MHFPPWTEQEQNAYKVYQGSDSLPIRHTTGSPDFSEVEHLYSDKPLRRPSIYATNNTATCPHCGMPL